MKKFTLCVAGLFMAALVHAQTPSPSSQLSAPAAAVDISKVLEFKETVHDFGKIPIGKGVQFDVVIKNISNDPVKIKNVSPQCGCTVAQADTTVYHAPGETFKVVLGFPNIPEGGFDKYADIFFSNGTTQRVKFMGTGYRVAENSAPANTAIQKIKTGGK